MNEFAPVDAGPWYRQRWPWLLMAGPATVIVAGAITIGLAIESHDGLVADDYYKRGLEINRTLVRNDHAATLGIGATVGITRNGVATVVLSSAAADEASQPSHLRLLLVHPTRAENDIVMRLTRTSPGHYVGTTAAPPAGRWRVMIEADTWRLASAPVTAPIEGLVMAAEPASRPDRVDESTSPARRP